MSKTKIWIFLDIIFLCVLAVYVFVGMKPAPFHGDESTLIALSLDWERLVYDDAVDNVRFDPPKHGEWKGIEQFTRILTGSLNPLTIGLARDVMNYPAEDVSGYWEWGGEEPEPYAPYMWYVNEDMGNIPSDLLLAISRFPSTLFTVLSVIVFFYLVLGLSKQRVAAWVSALMYTTTPSILINGRRAMQEGAMLFFTMLTIFFLYRLLDSLGVLESVKKEPKAWKNNVINFMLLGLASGFAVASKHTSVLVVMAAYLVLALIAVFKNCFTRVDQYGLRYWMMILASGFFSILVFFLLMPVWWSVPRALILAGIVLVFLILGMGVSRQWVTVGCLIAAGLFLGGFVRASSDLYDLIRPVMVIVSQRQDLAEIQAAANARMVGIGEKTSMLFNEAFISDTEYFEAQPWENYEVVREQIVHYENKLLDGRGGGWIWGSLSLILFLIGGYALIRGPKDGGYVLSNIWLILPAIIIWLTNILPWQRYYLPIIPPVSLLIGYGASQLWFWVKSFVLRSES